MKINSVACLSVCVFVFGACGGDTGQDTPDSAVQETVDGAVSGPDAGNADFTELISAPFTIPPGSEMYRCARLTATEDMYISEFKALAPNGTHHTVVTLQEPNGPDGDFDCSPTTLSDQMIYASGVGTDQLGFPEGVAMKISAGQQILLNLHLYNVSENPITSRAGTLVKTLPAAQVQQEAEMLFAGNIQFQIPSGGETTINGQCTFNQAATIMTVWPHMHQYGTYINVTLERGDGSGSEVLHDAPYSFLEQINWPLSPPVQVNSGDRVHVVCTYLNNSGSTIAFGDSSDNEMCFAGLYRYPKASNSFPFCIF